MPYVNLKIVKTGVSQKQKRQIVEEFTQTLVRVLGKDPKLTHIVIEEIELENWGYNSQLSCDPKIPG